jgi:6-pyruvoyltetrahydropterin/6-carboxytetrahydropterin synthase
MANVRLTKKFSFEMAHALLNYDGKCKNIHGHSYHLEVTVIGEPRNEPGHPEDGLVIDFGQLKKVVNTSVVDIFDHALVMKANHGDELTKMLSKNFERMIYTEYQPTCENLILEFAEKISSALPERATLHHLILHETATSYAEWYAADQAN